jgi:hypothetical protein
MAEVKPRASGEKPIIENIVIFGIGLNILLIITVMDYVRTS